MAAATAPSALPLSISGLSLEFPTYGGAIKALDDVSIEVGQAEIVGLVGESGCGKSVTTMAATRLLPQGGYRVTAGSIRLFGRDPFAMDEATLQDVRGKLVSTIFQEPMNALNPTIRIGRQLVEVIRRHEQVGQDEAERTARAILADMLIPEPERVMRAYPFELSGGMRQRVLIAMAFSCNPGLIIADEPTTALDVTVQAVILRLIQNRARRHRHLRRVHLPQHGGGVAAVRSPLRHVRRTHRRGRPDPRRAGGAAASLYPGSAALPAGARRAQGRAGSHSRHGAQSVRSARRLLLPSPLSRGHRPMPDQAAVDLPGPATSRRLLAAPGHSAPGSAS